jgi:hypothetical protein
MGDVRNAHKILAGKSEKKIPVGRFKHRWEDYIKMDLKRGYDGTDWIHLAQDRNQ